MFKYAISVHNCVVNSSEFWSGQRIPQRDSENEMSCLRSQGNLAPKVGLRRSPNI